MEKTELKGTYDVKLDWIPLKPGTPGDAVATVEAPRGPTLFDAVQEQLGLKLEARKGPMDVIVIDHAEKTPLGN